MRTSKLFPLLSGLVLSLASACGDDGSSDTDTTDTTDTGPDASDDSDSTETDNSDSDESSATDTTTTQGSSDDTNSDTDTTTDSDSSDEDAGGGDASDVSAAGDGGASDDSDGGTVDLSDGGTDGDGGGEGDGGGDEGDAEADAEPPLPEGACAESPVNPDNGSYAACDGTLNGGTCQLDCTQGNFIGGLATCTDGVWTEATCVRLGSLTAEIGNAATGADLADAEVYVEGFYDPASGDCDASTYCQVTGSTGVVVFEDFPSGPQKVVIVKDGFDEIALPVNVAPGDDPSIHLDALPTGFLSGNIVVLLGWEVGADLDLVVATPGSATDAGEAGVGECVSFDDEGSLSSAPFAQLDHDVKGQTFKGPETLRIALNDDETGPFYDGVYSIIVSGHNNRTLNEAIPSVRVIRAGENGGADVELFVLPEGSALADDATEWHVANLEGNTVSAVGLTESNSEEGTTAFPCVDGLSSF